MKWLSFLSKPAWQSADASKRATAVANEQHPDLVARIADFARHDADAQVRKAAIRRLTDLSLLSDRARLDHSADVRELARQRLHQFMIDSKVDPAQRQRQIIVSEDQEMLELIATKAKEVDLRRAAMERIQRPALIVDRCLKDPDAKLRMELLDRIDDDAGLERVADAARKSDKKLSRQARDRLDQSRLRQGDPATVLRLAESICTALEGFLRQRPVDLSEKLHQFDSEWQSLRPAPDAAMQTRYQGLTETLQHMLVVANRPLTALTEATDPTDAANLVAAPVAVESAPIEDVEDATLRAAWDVLAGYANRPIAAKPFQLQAVRSALAAAPPCASNDALRQQFDAFNETRRIAEADQSRALSVAQDALEVAARAYSKAVESGQMSKARVARHEAHLALNALPSALRDTKLLEASDAAFDQLAHWQRWSNDAQRKRLCDEIEASFGSGEHPDALLTRVKTAQTEWARLDESERLPGKADTPTSGLAHRFRVLCAKAIEPARPYLEKRGALRAQKREEIEATIALIETALAAHTASSDAFTLRTQTIAALRALDDVAPQDRRKLSERLRAAKDALDNRINEARAQAEAEKQKFIAQLRRKLSLSSGIEAVNVAKDAMARWKSLPRAERKLEDALWAELRAVVDPVFDKSKAERVEMEQTQSAERDAVNTVLQDLQALLGSDLDGHALELRLSAIQQQWRDLVGRSRDDERAFDRVTESLQSELQKRLQAQHHQSRRDAMALRAQITSTAATDREAITQAIQDSKIGNAERNALLQALAAMPDSKATPETHQANIEMDAVRAELLAQQPSPEHAQALRKQVQMQRLADKLAGNQIEAEADIQALWLRWLSASLPDDAATQAAHQRTASALEHLLQLRA